MSFLSEGFFERARHGPALRLVLLLVLVLVPVLVGFGLGWCSHFKVNYVDIVSSSYFFLFAALFFQTARNTPRPCPYRTAAHTQRTAACIKNSCHTRRYKDAHGSGGKAVAVDKCGGGGKRGWW